MKKNFKIPKEAKIQEYMSIDQYKKNCPSILNNYFKTNLLSIIDKLPDLPQENSEENEEELQAQFLDEKKETILAGLENVVPAIKHEFDTLGNDSEINQYSITKTLLGKGSHCFVKMGKKEGVNYAIKIISVDRIRKRFYIKEQNLLKMINMEIKILRKLKHKNIIKFYEAIYAVEKQRIFLVMENCQRGSLLKVIFQSAVISNEEWVAKVRKYFLQIVKGLQFIHKQNIIHRDIKTQNILLNDNDIIKIIDFNISTQIPPSGKITLSGKFVGTKTYAPPELLIPSKEEKVVDGRLIDVWALGISLLQLLERKHPFKCNNLQELLSLVEKPINIPSNYDSELKDLLLSMLKYENSSRISVDQIVVHPWLAEIRQ